jgi:hypothetical protein
VSNSIEDPLGNLGVGGVRLLGILIVKEGAGKGASLSAGAVRGTSRGAPLLGTRKDMERAQGTGISLLGGPAREPGIRLPGT